MLTTQRHEQSLAAHSSAAYYLIYAGPTYGSLMHGTTVELDESVTPRCGDLAHVWIEKTGKVELLQLVSVTCRRDKCVKAVLATIGSKRKRKRTFDAKRGDEVLAVVTGVVHRLKRTR